MRYIVFVLLVSLLLFQALPWAGGFTFSGPSRPDLVLSFLREVILLDLSKYNVTLLFDGLTLDHNRTRFKLEETGGYVEVDCRFKGSFMTWCMISKYGNAALHYVEAEPESYVERVRKLLDRYEGWSGDTAYKEIRNILWLVTKEKNQTIVHGSLKLTISICEPFVDFQWYRIIMVDGYSVELPSLGITFEGGELHILGDTYRPFKVGNTSLKISKEEAIGMARRLAGNFSWKVGVEPNVTVVREFKVLEEPVQASLSLWEREPLTLYPHWHVTLYLDKTYPGFVTGIMVGIWADTGETHYIKPLVASGYPTPPQETAGEDLSKEQPLQPGQMVIIVAALTTAAAISLLAAKKMRRKASPTKPANHN
ncbi:MAG: hypothetical protein QW612_05245 [Candidatus Bathyarchaeia archaeon]